MFIRCLALFAIVFALIGCSNEGESSNKPIQVDTKSGASNCLSHFSEHIDDFLNGKMSDTDINTFWNCTSEAVDEFSRLTTGPNGGHYTPESIWSFLHKYFLVHQAVDAKLLQSFMEAKRVILGGTSAVVTKGELELLRQFLDELRQISLEVRPSIRVISQADTEATDDQLMTANANIEHAMLRLSAWVSRRNEAYSFTELQELIEGLARNSEKPDQWKSLIESIPVLAQAKSIAVGFPKESVTADQWQNMFIAAGTGYGLLLNWHYGLGKDLFSSLARPIIRDTLDRFADVLEQGVLARQRANTNIALTEFDTLFQLMEERNWFGANIKASSLSEALRWVVARLLSRTVVAKLPSDPGIELKHVKVLRDVLNDWDDVSLFADRWPGGTPVQDRVKEFSWTLTSAWPQIVDDKGRLIFASKDQQLPYDQTSLHTLAWQFMVVSWLRDSYLNGPGEFEIQNMQTAVGEVLPLIQSFGYLLTTDLSVYKRLQKEADLFMSSSNGNLKISVNEATNFLSFLVSSYKSSNTWDSEVGTSCGQPVDPDCYRDAAYSHRDQVFSAMPELKRVFDQQDLYSWRAFSKKVELTVLGKAQDHQWQNGDRVLVFMLLHYLESFVRRYDTNSNGTISFPESEPAYNQFEANLIKLFGPLGMPDEDIKPFFTFLMKNGETYFNRYGGQIEFIHWKLHPEIWSYEANRDTLVNILYELSKL